MNHWCLSKYFFSKTIACIYALLSAIIMLTYAHLQNVRPVFLGLNLSTCFLRPSVNIYPALAPSLDQWITRHTHTRNSECHYLTRFHLDHLVDYIKTICALRPRSYKANRICMSSNSLFPDLTTSTDLLLAPSFQDQNGCNSVVQDLGLIQNFIF